jgi:hypothetical protein
VAFGLLSIGSTALTSIEWWRAVHSIHERFAPGTGAIVALGVVCTAAGTYLFHGARRGDPFHTAPFAIVLAPLTLASIGAMLTAPALELPPDDGRTESFVYGAFAVGGLLLAFSAILGVFVGTQLESLDRRSDARDRVEFAAARWGRLAVALATTSAIVMAPLRVHSAGDSFTPSALFRSALFAIGAAAVVVAAIRDGVRWRWIARVAEGRVRDASLTISESAPAAPSLVTLVGSAWKHDGEGIVFLRHRDRAQGAPYRTQSHEAHEAWASFPGTVAQLLDVIRTRVLLDVVMVAICGIIAVTRFA